LVRFRHRNTKPKKQWDQCATEYYGRQHGIATLLSVGCWALNVGSRESPTFNAQRPTFNVQ
jgi:hypothetical protein